VRVSALWQLQGRSENFIAARADAPDGRDHTDSRLDTDALQRPPVRVPDRHTRKRHVISAG
jgi:hypothetical protein